MAKTSNNAVIIIYRTYGTIKPLIVPFQSSPTSYMVRILIYDRYRMILLGADNYYIGCNEVLVIDALELMDCRYYR